MSTEYILFEEGNKEFSIYEHSNNFDIVMEVTEDEENLEVQDLYICGLTLTQLKEVNQRLTNVISYFDTDYKACQVNYY